MKFINPYDIAKYINFKDLDLSTYKKFKKILMTELELNNGKIKIDNKILYQNEIYDLLEIIDKNKNILNIYNTIYNKKGLNKFLNGLLDFRYLKLLKYTLALENKQLVEFISPYLATRLSKAYKDAYLNRENDILQIEPPIEKKYHEQIYKPIYQILKNKENELENLLNEHYSLNKVKDIVNNLNIINILPSYFTKIRNDIAYAIRGLSIDSWNNNKDLDLAMDLINYALKFNVSNKIKDEFLSDKNDLENILQEQKIIKFMDKINNVLNDSPLIFSNKIDKIIYILKYKDNEIKDDIMALVTYKLINEYVEKNKIIIKDNITSLVKIFNYLLKISNDSNLNKLLKENIDILNKLKKMIRGEEIDGIFEFITIAIIIFGALIGGADYGFGGLLLGGFIGLLIGSIIKNVVGGFIKIIANLLS